MKKHLGWMLIVFAALNTAMAHADDDVAYEDERVVDADDNDDVALLDDDMDEE